MVSTIGIYDIFLTYFSYKQVLKNAQALSEWTAAAKTVAEYYHQVFMSFIHNSTVYT